MGRVTMWRWRSHWMAQVSIRPTSSTRQQQPVAHRGILEQFQCRYERRNYEHFVGICRTTFTQQLLACICVHIASHWQRDGYGVCVKLVGCVLLQCPAPESRRRCRWRSDKLQRTNCAGRQRTLRDCEPGSRTTTKHSCSRWTVRQNVRVGNVRVNTATRATMKQL